MYNWAVATDKSTN